MTTNQPAYDAATGAALIERVDDATARVTADTDAGTVEFYDRAAPQGAIFVAPQDKTARVIALVPYVESSTL